MVDMVVHRHELRPTIARLLRILLKQPAAAPKLAPPAPEEPADDKAGKKTEEPVAVETVGAKPGTETTQKPSPSF
jgi:acetyl-CoA carboxylase carboxyl transferase subunit beta